MMIFAYPKPLLENFLELFILYPMIFCGLLLAGIHNYCVSSASTLYCDSQSRSWFQHSHKHQCKCGHWHCMAIFGYKENQMVQNMPILFLFNFHQNEKHNIEIP